MTGRRDPPEGTPEGLPGGGEDEYRSVVFDESFVRAARLQEFSAQERMGVHARAVRSLPARPPGPRSRSVLLLVLMVAVVFGTAIYLGVRAPYQASPAKRAQPLRITLIPLAPQGPVPGGAPADLYARGPATHLRIGASGITLPVVRRTKNFSESQVMAALTTAKDYLVESSLDPEVLTGGAVRTVRMLLDPAQQDQFDRSTSDPAADGHHAATGWLVRFDAAEVALADPEVRVRGALSVWEAGPDALEVISDHTFAYALRPASTASRPTATPGARPSAAPAPADSSDHSAPATPSDGPDRTGRAAGTDAATRDDDGLAGSARTAGTGGEGPADRTGPTAARPATGAASLFTVRRELHFRFDRDDLQRHRVELVSSTLQAGPHACAEDMSGALRPLLAGERAPAGAPAGTDPYALSDSTAALCGALAPRALPSPPKG